jgi:hypothetical protein
MVGKSSLKCQFCQIMAIDQTTGSVNGSVVWSMAHWWDHQVFQWPLIRPPSLCRWPLIRPLCNNPNGHWSDQQLCQSMATIRPSNLSQWAIWETTRVLLMTIGLLVANWTDHWVTPNGPFIDQTVGSPFNGHWWETTGSFQWLLIRRLLDPLNDCQGPPQEQPILICDIHAMHR